MKSKSHIYMLSYKSGRKTMSKNKKMIRNFILFILLIILTFYFVLRDQNIYEMFNILKSVKIYINWIIMYAWLFGIRSN